MRGTALRACGQYGVVLMLAATSCRAAKKSSHEQAAQPTASSAASAPGTTSSGCEPARRDGDGVALPSRAPIPRRLPTGALVRLTCEAARAILDDAIARLASPPSPLTPANAQSVARTLADGVVDWADPHGLWTAAPDSPVASLIRARSSALRVMLEGIGERAGGGSSGTPPNGGAVACRSTLRPIGEALQRWVAELAREYAVTKRGVGAIDPARARAALTEAAFEDGAVTRPARSLARELGRRTALVVSTHEALAGDEVVATSRWFPELDAEAWGEVVLAAAVRAYVPLLDPHGAWAPGDEGSTLYDRTLELTPPPRAWGASTRTALGVRIDAGAIPPLRDGDVVLAVDGVSLAGLSAEAIDQLAEASDPREATPRQLRLVRSGSVLSIELRSSLGEEPAPGEGLVVTEMPYGDGAALVVRIPDVPDALGDDLARAISSATTRAGASGGADAPQGQGAAKKKRRIVGVLLDLRGNGGGSIEGATGALGVFLAGAPLFPLRHRDGVIETERASEPPIEDRWSGPVAALVDGGTASAAEMISGALRAYRRGPVVGALTYGKGCAQEYSDDAVGAGVLRLTTLLFALPDGSPIQRTGVRPDVLLPLAPVTGVRDRESDLLRAAPAWRGPDVRDPKRLGEAGWPLARQVGPCADDVVCRALRSIAGARPRDVAKR